MSSHPVLLALALLATSSATQSAQFDEKPCTGPLAGTAARCGSVTVRESAASERTIDLNVVVVPALKKSDAAVPMFHFEGGPGIAATGAAGYYLGPGSIYRQNRDVVVIDQRGSGGSNPLHCPALEHRSSFDNEYSDAGSRPLTFRDVENCRDALAKVADLTSYSTTHIAADFDSVREALGHPRIDIWAVSYGTRLAQEYIRQFGSHVAHAVLIGLVPSDYRTPLYHAANAQRVLDLLFYKCQIDTTCSARYPHLRNDWASMQEALRRGVNVKSTDATITLHAGPVDEAIRSMMTTAAGQRELPSMIHQAAAGDYAPLMKRLGRNGSPFALGQYFSIVCSEGAARIPKREIEQYTAGTFLGNYRVAEETAACSEWPQHALDEAFFQPIRSSPPMLVIGGEMDQVATPEWGRQFCASLPECRFLLVPDMGHVPFDGPAWTNGECVDAIAAAFFSNPGADTSCITAMRPPAFR